MPSSHADLSSIARYVSNLWNNFNPRKLRSSHWLWHFINSNRCRMKNVRLTKKSPFGYIPNPNICCVAKMKKLCPTLYWVVIIFLRSWPLICRCQLWDWVAADWSPQALRMTLAARTRTCWSSWTSVLYRRSWVLPPRANYAIRFHSTRCRTSSTWSVEDLQQYESCRLFP